jgi:hypothetical protein
LQLMRISGHHQICDHGERPGLRMNSGHDYYCRVRHRPRRWSRNDAGAAAPPRS